MIAILLMRVSAGRCDQAVQAGRRGGGEGQNLPHVAMPDFDDGRRGIDASNVDAQTRDHVAIGDVGLGQQDEIGQRHLAHRLGLTLQRGLAKDRIDRRSHRLHCIAPRHNRIADEQPQDGTGIGKPRGLDDHAVKTGQQGPLPA